MDHLMEIIGGQGEEKRWWKLKKGSLFTGLFTFGDEGGFKMNHAGIGSDILNTDGKSTVT